MIIAGKTWVYFLKRKLEVFKWFEEFKATAEKQSDYNIRTLRYDQGVEYTSNDFKVFYT
jgi:hypothetical protein